MLLNDINVFDIISMALNNIKNTDIILMFLNDINAFDMRCLCENVPKYLFHH